MKIQKIIRIITGITNDISTGMLFVAVVVTIVNCNTWLEIEIFAEIKSELLKKYESLKME